MMTPPKMEVAPLPTMPWSSGALGGEVEVAPVVRQHGALVRIAEPVGDAVVEVIHHEDLERSARQVQDEAGQQDSAQRDVGVTTGDAIDDQVPQVAQDHHGEEGHRQVGTHVH